MAPPYVTHLTTRILQDGNVEYAWKPAPTFELSSWVKDELLVSEDAPQDERDRLNMHGWGPRSSVLRSTAKSVKRRDGVKDIEIWAPQNSKRFLMVEAVISDLMHFFARSPKVSPNHLLVPCNLGCYCPADAPTFLPRQLGREARIANFVGKEPVRVVVIDTGYIKKESLENRKRAGGFQNVQGEVFKNGAWVPSKRDDAYTIPNTNILQLLDGHGTFSAGVIAERCPRAHVKLVGIRAIESAATEAAVARAIYLNADADVIVPVFAFHALHGLDNWTFPNILPQLKPGSVVVCPAGNESSYAPHYPAALPWPRYPVVGIGSFVSNAVSTRTGESLSKFSDFGDWVFGYTVGEKVPGLYFRLTRKVEDGPNTSVAYKGWARWSGTSFAAPKVAAYIANKAPTAGSAVDAAAALRLGAPQVPLYAPGSVGLTLGRDFRQFAT